LGKFSELVDPERFSVSNFPGYVFLCGAALNNPLTSLRAQFYEIKIKPNEDLLQRVKLAEEANSWYQSNEHFHDLLELEEYLASLSSYILLFVESPGAIAELGAFTQIPTLNEKLIIVIEQTYDRQSFIVDGPIKQMRRLGNDFVLVYPWLLPFRENETSQKINEELLPGTLDGIQEFLDDKLKKSTKKIELFKERNHGHRMLLIADLVALLGITNIRELQTIITEQFGFDIDESKFKKYLFLLCQVGLITSETFGTVKYYFGKMESLPYIAYSPKSPTDRLKLRNMLREEFKLSNDKTRALAAHNARKGDMR
jgi:hypothetical protein